MSSVTVAAAGTSTSDSLPNEHHTSHPEAPSQLEIREWPAKRKDIQAARTFLRECASAHRPTLILPDKDADGLCAGLIVQRALVALGLPPHLLSVHFVAKGSNVHAPEERARMGAYGARYVVVVDQGSRGGGPIVDGDGDGDVKILIVDHHWSEVFPEGAQVLSSARHPPIAPSSTLAYVLCLPLHPSLARTTDYLCAMGTMGDLGTAMKWEPLWPDMSACFRAHKKKTIGEAIALVNAPRRTARYDVESAWNALLTTTAPRALTSPNVNPSIKRLHEARSEVKSEVNRCARARPYFSGDGRVALVRIKSAAQIHPVIATRWAHSLKSAKLQVVMCANDGYLTAEGEGDHWHEKKMTNFSCRVAKSANQRRDAEAESEADVNVIELLKAYASSVEGLLEDLGDDFARGHKEASGGVVRTEQFERLWGAMVDSVPDGPPRKKRKVGSDAQKNTLDGWVMRSNRT